MQFYVALFLVATAVPLSTQQRRERRVCTASEVCIPLRECPSLRSKVGVSRSEAERASVLRLIGSRLCGQGEIGQNLDVCCDRTDASAAAAPTRQEGFEFKTIWHDVAGTVQIVDDKTLVIRNFVYDGEGPDAFFTVGVRTRKPNPKDATPIRYPATNPQTAHTYRDSGIPILGEFRGEDITLELPATQDITTRDIKWISVWCRDYTIDFGHAIIASDADVPRQ